jgi:hypothetical protein
MAYDFCSAVGQHGAGTGACYARPALTCASSASSWLVHSEHICRSAAGLHAYSVTKLRWGTTVALQVNLNYFGHTADLDTLVAGIKVSRGIAEQAPFSKYLSHEQWPGSSANSDADLEVFVRSSACSGNALTGTWYHMPYGRICA